MGLPTCGEFIELTILLVGTLSRPRLTKAGFRSRRRATSSSPRATVSQGLLKSRCTLLHSDIIADMAGAKRTKTKEDKLDMLAWLIKSESEDIRKDVKDEIKSEMKNLKREMDIGFAGVNRRLDTAIQPQLDDHAHRIKKLETKVLS